MRIQFRSARRLNSVSYSRRNFTLIERRPSKGRAYLLAASANPANFPIQAGSLTCAATRATGMQGGVTKSRDGKPVRLANTGRVSMRHSPAFTAESPLDCGKTALETNGGLLASRSGETNMQAAG